MTAASPEGSGVEVERLDLERFETGFTALLARIAPGAADRERRRVLLHEEVRELRELGFGRLRLPVESGGAGLSLTRLFELLVELSAADASLGHLWRGHIAFVEDLRLHRQSPRRWVERIAAGDLIGNAQSERHETAVLATRIQRDESGVHVSGEKYYTTGSIYADWIHLAALDGETRVGLTVSARHPGVTVADDWDGFGQTLTGSGTTRFTEVPVDPADIVGLGHDDGHWEVLGSVFQLALLAVIAGIAQRAVDDTVDFVRPRRRTFGFAGEAPPREDPLVQQVVGSLRGAAISCRSLVVGAATELEAAIDAEADPERLREIQLTVFALQRLVPEIALDAATELFEVGGASATSAALSLDRHWRNIRTIASHNPVAQRTRALGQFTLNGTLPDWKAPGA